MKNKKIIGAMVFLAGSALSSGAMADSLREALAAAYTSNPTLEAERAALRAVDEGLVRANSGFLPSIDGTIDYNWQTRDVTSGTSVSNTDPFNKFYQVQLTQPIFSGFQTVNSRKEQKNLIQAGRGRLLQVEQQTLLDAVTAYMDVMRDQAVLELNNNNVQVLERQLQASRDRFRVGDVTRTDVAQSEARLAGAISARITAEANLAASRARYREIIGSAPGTLDEPPALPPLPSTLEEAWAIAMENNPTLFSARYNERAADNAVDRTKGVLLPQIQGYLRFQRSEGETNFGVTTVDVISEVQTAGVQLTIPLYRGGAQYSDIRRAKQTRSQRRMQVLAAERSVVSTVRNAWEQFRAATASIESNQSQVRANEIALDGVRQEAAVGSRTTLDVLDAEQELLDSRVNLVRAERDRYVAAMSLLSAVGYMNAKTLDLPVDAYDAEEYYKDVRFQFVGWGTGN